MPTLSIDLPDTTYAKLRDAKDLSARISGIIECYEAMTHDAKPALSAVEWEGLWRLVQGDWMAENGKHNAPLLVMFAGSVRPSPEDWKWIRERGFDPDATAHKLARLSYAGKVAVIEELRYPTPPRGHPKRPVTKSRAKK